MKVGPHIQAMVPGQGNILQSAGPDTWVGVSGKFLETLFPSTVIAGRVQGSPV